ncbi:hypothetical protein G9F72_026805 [Clostridium estertheticum]|uniref:hypothetical protein n=1 Tax=Clostridium estertheticum TaxID=238834 RepID=UPI0013E93940|nr:hypothetical protein [Clostridium estertheticum]MBZ9689882.1 hypothetical protein [Clostridium estertheticum]
MEKKIYYILGTVFIALIAIFYIFQMNFYVFGQITVWITNVLYIVALVAVIKLAIKATQALDIYINDKKNIR